MLPISGNDLGRSSELVIVHEAYDVVRTSVPFFHQATGYIGVGGHHEGRTIAQRRVRIVYDVLNPGDGKMGGHLTGLPDQTQELKIGLVEPDFAPIAGKIRYFLAAQVARMHLIE